MNSGKSSPRDERDSIESRILRLIVDSTSYRAMWVAPSTTNDEAKKVLAELPLVKAGLIDFEVIPLGAFANWEILFASDAK